MGSGPASPSAPPYPPCTSHMHKHTRQTASASARKGHHSHHAPPPIPTMASCPNPVHSRQPGPCLLHLPLALILLDGRTGPAARGLRLRAQRGAGPPPCAACQMPRCCDPSGWRGSSSRKDRCIRKRFRDQAQALRVWIQAWSGRVGLTRREKCPPRGASCPDRHHCAQET